MTTIDPSVISSGFRPNLFDGIVIKPYITYMPVGPNITYTREQDVVYNDGFYGKTGSKSLSSNTTPLTNLEINFVTCVCDTGVDLIQSYQDLMIRNSNFYSYVAPIQLPTIDELISSFRYSNPSGVDFKISGRILVMRHGSSSYTSHSTAAEFEFSIRNGTVTDKTLSPVSSVTQAYAFSEDIESTLSEPAWAVKADVEII